MSNKEEKDFNKEIDVNEAYNFMSSMESGVGGGVIAVSVQQVLLSLSSVETIFGCKCHCCTH